MKAFREARPASFAWNYFKTMAQTVVMWTIFLVVGPMLISWVETQLGLPKLAGRPLPGTLMFVAGGSLGLTAGYTMARIGEGTPLPIDTARNLVIAGPYRYLRNPMAAAGTVQSLGVGVILGSPAVFAATFFSALLWDRVVRPAEETDLIERFGEPFVAYQHAVRCWIPHRHPYSGLDHRSRS